MKTEIRVGGSTALALAVSLITSACSELTGNKDYLCPAIEGEFAVHVTTSNAVTGELIPGLPRGAVTDGDFSDSLKVIGYSLELGPGLVPIAFGAAWNRPGTYTLTIERDGYLPFSASGLRATMDVCGVLPASMKAELVPEQE